MAVSDEFSGIGDPVYARVRERIRADILSGFFKPGVRIKTAALGARYGVSQMPIREALQRLQGEGLVILAPNRGASVRSVDAQFISNIYDIRIALESMLVKRAMRFLTDSHMFSLYAAESRFEEAVQKQDMERILEANHELHTTVYRLARNTEATDVMARHSELIQSLRRRYGYSQARLTQVISEHRQLLRAIEQRDVEAAAQASEKHIENARVDLLTQAGLTEESAATDAEPQPAPAAR
jgi:DNA-binding GntR family transcriptional regulator